METRISYIATVKNRINHIGLFFEEYKRIQTAADELIVIDGDSTDGTKEVIEKYRDLIDVYISEPDLNATDALNKGIKLAKGKYIKNYPVDDVIYNLDYPVYYMNQNPGIDLLVLGGVKQTSSGKQRTFAPRNYGSRYEDVFIYGACGTGFFLRQSSISKLGLFDVNSIVADREYALRAIKLGKIGYLKGDFYWHGIYIDSISLLNFKDWGKANWRLMKEYCTRRFYYCYRLLYLLRKIKPHSKEAKK